MAPARVFPSGGRLLLEREAQVAALEALAGAARTGGGRFVVIEGSAGIGKTRLLAEARAIAGSAGMQVLAARGGEFEGEFAHGIVRQLFEPLLASASSDLRAKLLSGLRHSLKRCSEPRSRPLHRGAPAEVSSRDPPRALLAGRQRGPSSADPSRYRRPALGGHALTSVAPLLDAKARGSAPARGRCSPSARGPEPRSHARRRAHRRSGSRCDPARTAWP